MTSRLFVGIIVTVMGVAVMLGADVIFPGAGGMALYWRYAAIAVALWGVYTVGRFLCWKSMEAGSRGRKLVAGSDDPPRRPPPPR